MKLPWAIHFLILLCCFTATHASAYVHAINKSIYGDDNRRLITELDKKFNSKQIEISRSVLAQVPKWRITSENDAFISLQTKNLEDGINICFDEKFSDMPIVASCSAFLVGSDLLLTAGHCVKELEDCQNNYWVFDYNDDAGFKDSLGTAVFKKENIVSCSQILAISNTPEFDFALIKINRKITNRVPLKIPRNGKLNNNDNLFVVGHPLGLPKIIADQAVVLDNSPMTYFLTNADTYVGNSGSPVINSATLMVEGILINGSLDFQIDSDLYCKRSNRCIGAQCKGEKVQRTSRIPINLIPKI